MNAAGVNCNRFGAFIGSAHAAMTAEGDNSVLMQKVAKERLMMYKPQKVDLVAEDLDNDEFLHFLLLSRDLNHFSQLGMKLMKAGKSGLFETWMLKESDLVQDAALAFGELFISEQMKKKIECQQTDASLKPILTQLRRLYLLDAVQRDLGWFLANQLMSTSCGRDLNEVVAESCRTIAPYSLQLCDSFGMTDAMLSAPIALDWVDYNVGDNRGEVQPTC